jgi:primosomal protein N' (replication factor Y)
MFYYEIALLKSPLSPLTYSCRTPLKIGQQVLVNLRNRKNLVLGVAIKEVSKPIFKCVLIEEILDNYYDKMMLETSQFISLYYVCSLGEALSLYTPFTKLVNS